MSDTNGIGPADHSAADPASWRQLAATGGLVPSGDGPGHRRLGDDAALIVELARGRRHAEIAEVAGLSIRTVERRSADPEVQAAVAAHRALVLEQAAAEMGVALQEAVAHARAVLADEDQPGGTRLKAASLLLSHSPAIIGLDNAERRLSAVEVAMGRQAAHSTLTSWSP